MKAMDKKLTYGVWEYFSMILGLSELLRVHFLKSWFREKKVSNIGKYVFFWKDLYNRCLVTS